MYHNLNNLHNKKNVNDVRVKACLAYTCAMW